MLRNRSLSFYYKRGEKNVDDISSTKAKSHEKPHTEEAASTLPRNNQNPFSGSTPVLTQLLGDLEENPIFRQQRQKNARSKSIDFLTTKPVVSSPDNRSAGLEKDQYKYGGQRKSLSTTNLPEVLKTLQLSRDDSNAQYYPPQKFPLPDDTEGIQYRKNPIASYRISKTTDFDFPRKPFGSDDSCHDFEARGCSRIQLPNDGMRKLKKIEFIKYKNGIIYRCTENGDVPLSYSTVRLRTARMLNKREVEFRDEHNKIFILIFDSSKDAKLFIESDKLSPYIADDHKSSVKKTLFRLLGKRSSREVLEKKGIYQNEPIFGNTLKNIYNIERGVPQFILKTIELIEKPENIVSLGIYRTSGNLATIQKIRFEVDKGRLEILDDFSKDVDVLTGSLKLFFRELKEPLISCEACDQLLNLTKPDMSYTKKDKDKIKSVLNHLPEANWDTLRVLLKHLIEVAKYKDQNKMDTYNLSVCWGPTVIFATESLDCANYKDIVTQSTEATRMFESLLLFYINNPEELETGKRKQDSLDRNRNLVFRQDSKESIKSSDSNTSKGTAKRSASNLSLDIDDVVVKKMVELIESNLNVDGLYRRPGAADKISKISKKLSKKKLTDLDKYKNDVHELCSSLRAYLQSQEPLVTRQVVEQVIKICDKTPCLEQNTRQKIMLALQDLPKRDTFTFLIKHIILVLDNEPQQVPRSEIITVWVNIFNQKHLMESDEKFFNFLNIILEVYDEKKPDIIGLHFGMNNGLLNDLRNLQKERDRTSKYDNVPDDVDIRHEATFLDEKTDHLEHTKL